MDEFYGALTGKGGIKNGTVDDAVAVMRLIDTIYGKKNGIGAGVV